jgi:ankyrin repeat protein
MYLSQNGSTALILAAARGFPSMVTLLLENKADLLHRDHVSRSSCLY